MASAQVGVSHSLPHPLHNPPELIRCHEVQFYSHNVVFLERATHFIGAALGNYPLTTSDLISCLYDRAANALQLAEHIFPKREGLLVFLSVYADDSSDQRRERILSAAGFLAWPRDFYYASIEWQIRLEKDGLKYFRASECEGLYGEFDPQNPPGFGLSQARARALTVRHDLVEIIKKHGMGGMSASLALDDFYGLIAENPKAKKHFGQDPTLLIYKTLIKAVSECMERDWPEDPKLKVAFTFDSHQKWKVAEQAYEELRLENPACAKRMVHAGHADDEEYPALQMADLMAHEARQKTLEWMVDSDKETHVFKALTGHHNVYFMGVAQRKELLETLALIKD